MKTTCLAALAALSIAGAASAQVNDGQILGKVEYLNSCASCHGRMAHGDGALADQLTVAPPNLTRLEADNGGVFPISYVYEVIANSFEVGAHGTTDMPAWGLRYSQEAERVLGDDATEAEREDFVTFRILSLIEYLASLQEG